MAYSFYSYEGAAQIATNPAAKRALFLAAAAVHRSNAQGRLALARSYNAPNGTEARLAREALANGRNAIREARLIG